MQKRSTWFGEGASVYFARGTRDGLIKIGCSTVVVDRLRQVARDSRQPVELLATLLGTRAEESGLHERFDDERIERTEWFEPSPRLLHFVAVVRREATLASLPDPVAYRLRLWRRMRHLSSDRFCAMTCPPLSRDEFYRFERDDEPPTVAMAFAIERITAGEFPASLWNLPPPVENPCVFAARCNDTAA